MTNKLQDLIAQRAALDAQIATEKTAQLAVAADAAAQAFADAGVSLDEGAAILLSRHNASKHRQGATEVPAHRHGCHLVGQGPQTPLVQRAGIGRRG